MRSDLYLSHQIFYTNLCQVLVNLLAKINDSDVFFCKSLLFWVRNNTTEIISVDFRLRQEKSSQLALHRLRDLSLNFTLGTSFDFVCTFEKIILHLSRLLCMY